jgi:drug/metabolite transporter (DMT)-like permease
MTPSPAVKLASLATLVAIWGTTWAVIRVGLRGIPPLTGVAIRFTLAGLVLWVVALALGLRGGALRAPLAVWVINGLCTFAISYGIVYWAEQTVPTGLTSVLFATFPLFVAALAHFVLPGERLRATSMLGLLVGLLGVAVLFGGDLLRVWRGGGDRRLEVACAVLLLAPLAAAVGQVTVKRWGSAVHTLPLNAGSMLVCAVATGFLALLLERGRPLRLDTPAVLSVLYLSLFGTAVTFTLYFWLLRHMPATHLSLTSYVIPVVAVIVGAIVFDEAITARLLLGGVLVVAGTALTTGRRFGSRAGDAPDGGTSSADVAAP